MRAALRGAGRLAHSWAPAAQIRKSPVLALLEAAAQEVERRPLFFLPGPVGPMVGLGLRSLAAARATSMASRMRTDGRDGLPPTYVFVRKTA